jgi:hypothetical protein
VQTEDETVKVWTAHSNTDIVHPNNQRTKNITLVRRKEAYLNLSWRGIGNTGSNIVWSITSKAGLWRLFLHAGMFSRIHVDSLWLDPFCHEYISRLGCDTELPHTRKFITLARSCS